MKKSCRTCKFCSFDYRNVDGVRKLFNYCMLTNKEVNPDKGCDYWNNLKKWKEARKHGEEV